MMPTARVPLLFCPLCVGLGGCRDKEKEIIKKKLKASKEHRMKTEKTTVVSSKATKRSQVVPGGDDMGLEEALELDEETRALRDGTLKEPKKLRGASKKVAIAEGDGECLHQPLRPHTAAPAAADTSVIFITTLTCFAFVFTFYISTQLIDSKMDAAMSCSADDPLAIGGIEVAKPVGGGGGKAKDMFGLSTAKRGTVAIGDSSKELGADTLAATQNTELGAKKRRVNKRLQQYEAKDTIGEEGSEAPSAGGAGADPGAAGSGGGGAGGGSGGGGTEKELYKKNM